MKATERTETRYFRTFALDPAVTWVQATVRIRDTPHGPALSITGAYGKGSGPARDRDWFGGGQVVSEIAEAFPELRPLLPFHLNDMCAGCEHQREAGWQPASYGSEAYRNGTDCVGKPCLVCGYRYGTAWLYMPIPDDVLALAQSWVSK